MKQVVVSAFLIDGRGRILMSRRAHFGLYCPPGGKVESNESLEEGLAREVKEEINVAVDPKDMDFLGFCDLDEKVIFFYLIFNWIGEVKNNEPKKHRKWEWLVDTPGNKVCVEGIRYFNKFLRENLHERIRNRPKAA